MYVLTKAATGFAVASAPRLKTARIVCAVPRAASALCVILKRLPTFTVLKRWKASAARSCGTQNDRQRWVGWFLSVGRLVGGPGYQILLVQGLAEEMATWEPEGAALAALVGLI